MSKKVILHIGCEKTGTTSIQNTLAANRETLLKEYRILYPKSLGVTANHTKLAIYALNEDKKRTQFIPKNQTLKVFRENLRTDFLEEVANTPADTIIISAEWLHRLKDDDEFVRLHSLLTQIANRVEVVLYVRRQDQLALSLYSTSLKAGNYKRFSFPCIDTQSSLPYYFDFLSIYRKWKSVFGTGNVRIRIFDREKLYQGDVVRDFIHEVIGLNDEVFRYYAEDNRSLNNRGILVLRFFNFLLDTFKQFVKPEIARRLRDKLAKRFVGTPSLATKEQCSEFMEWFKNSNHKLEIEYLADNGQPINLF